MMTLKEFYEYIKEKLDNDSGIFVTWKEDDLIRFWLDQEEHPEFEHPFATIDEDWILNTTFGAYDLTDLHDAYTEEHPEVLEDSTFEETMYKIVLNTMLEDIEYLEKRCNKMKIGLFKNMSLWRRIHYDHA